MTKIFEGLNPAQKEAVETLSGPVMILAGAGSGKTKTLTHRIANLIANGVLPSEILALTFTNKAAREMRERLARLLDRENSFNFMPWMGTFHAICVKILRVEAANVGLDKNFVIYDTDDRLALIKRAMKKLDISDKRVKPKAAEAAISKAKNEGKDPDEMLADAYYPNQRDIAAIYEKYEDKDVLVVCHAGVYREFYQYFNGITENYLDIPGLHNCEYAEFTLHNMGLQDKYFDFIKFGTKRLELRLYDKKRQKIHVGDLVRFKNSHGEILRCRVEALHIYPNFATLFADFPKEMLSDKSISKNEMLDIMQEFYPEKRQHENGVVGIQIEPIK